MIKKTFKELNKFSDVVRKMLDKRPELADSKLGYAIKRFEEKSVSEVYREYNQELTMVRIDNALTNKETGAMVKDPNPMSQRGFEFDKEGLKNVIKEEMKIEKAWMQKEFDVEPFICKKENLPKDLTEEQIEVFDGLVLEKEKEKTK